MPATLTQKAPAEPAIANPETRPARPPGNPVARILAQVSRLNQEYADYQMEAGIWRKLSI